MRLLLVRPLALIAACLLCAVARGADEAALRAALDRLSGEWTGEVQVKAMDGFLLKTVPASRRASWEGGTFVAELTLSDGTGEYVVVSRQAIRLGRLESSVSRPSQPEDRYLGEIAGGALVWTNAEGNRRDAREQVAERGGELVLESSSVEPMRAFGVSGLVRVEGRFQRPAPAQVDHAPVFSVSSGLEAELVAQRTRADEAERRATAAETQLRALEGTVAEARAGETRLTAELEQVRQQAAQFETDRASLNERLAAAEAQSVGTVREAEANTEARRVLAVRVTALEAELVAVRGEREELLARITSLEQSAARARSENEHLLAANQRLEEERTARETRPPEATAAVPDAAPAIVIGAAVPTPASPFSAAMREQLIAEVEQMERRVLELESERNTMREQLTLSQRQLEETRRLRDDTLVRFQTVVSELNAMREEKERLARANVSLQAEVRSAQQAARSRAAPTAPAGSTPAAPVETAGTAPVTTVDGKTADMVIAALQIIGVTRGDGGEDKAILDGRVYRNGDLVEVQLGIVFVRIDDNALVFKDRRGREYRRRF